MKPEGWPTLVPRIVAKDARELVAFLQRVLDARGDWEDERPTVLRIDESIVMVTEVGVRPAAPAFLYVYVDDVDATFARAVKEGVRVLEEPFDLPYGDRRAMLEDRWGNTWQIATHLR